VKQLNIVTVCRASLRESWWLNVPDDFDMSGPDATITASELLDHPEQFGAQITLCEDEPFDEDDRIVVDWEEVPE